MLLAINITRWLASRSGHLTVRGRPGWRPNQPRDVRGSCQWLRTGKRQFPPAPLLTSCSSQTLLAINFTRRLASQSGHLTVRARNPARGVRGSCQWLRTGKRQFSPALLLTSCSSQMLLAINFTRRLASQSGHLTVPGWRPNPPRGVRGSCQWLKTGKMQFSPALLLTSCTPQMLFAINITR